MTGAVELVGLPVGGPTTLPKVREALRMAATDTADDVVLEDCVGAVNFLVRRWPVSTAAVGQVTWPDSIERGATMLAVRLYRRKDSPTGVEAFSPATGAVYVARSDPEIAMLLKLGSWTAPGIG